VGSSGRGVGTKKGEMRLNMVDVYMKIERMKPVKIIVRRGKER
jgi:hypothetical protein